jgi:hypothetical protein
VAIESEEHLLSSRTRFVPKRNSRIVFTQNSQDGNAYGATSGNQAKTKRTRSDRGAHKRGETTKIVAVPPEDAIALKTKNISEESICGDSWPCNELEAMYQGRGRIAMTPDGIHHCQWLCGFPYVLSLAT